VDFLSFSRDACKDIAIAKEENLSNVFVDIAFIVGKCVPHPLERKHILTNIYEQDLLEQCGSHWRMSVMQNLS
jgi:hypothetical protein